MPIHDWSRVSAGIFHDFHCSWLVEIKGALNDGLLPAGYYALAEQIAGSLGPDVLTLQTLGTVPEAAPAGTDGSTAGLAVAPPKVRFTAKAGLDPYALKQRALVIRHSSDDRVIAL